jgi:prepilin-type N-terminal cleavage/methylation domain-containing protein
MVTSQNKKSFTLVELIIVVIIVGILASLGLTQYSNVVEKSRLAEAKTRIGTMRQLAYSYYLEKGVFGTITNEDVGVDNTCRTSDYFSYRVGITSDHLVLAADRCTGGGKPPNVSMSKRYTYYMNYYPATTTFIWHCYYRDDNSSCFGLPAF